MADSTSSQVVDSYCDIKPRKLAEQAAPSAAWRPIATAPAEKRVLVFEPGINGDGRTIAHSWQGRWFAGDIKDENEVWPTLWTPLPDLERPSVVAGWTPLTDGDALRLMAKLKLSVMYGTPGIVQVSADDGGEHCTAFAMEPVGDDIGAATRRAIDRVAAAMGHLAT